LQATHLGKLMAFHSCFNFK